MKDLMQRRKVLKKKFVNCNQVLAAWTSFGHPSIPEIFSKSGVDFIGIDIEHSTISQEQSQRIIAACQANNTLCLPRIASHNVEMTRRVLDSGADGLIVPMVNSKKDVENVISWMKYPPLGRRGFGVSRAQGYGFDFQEYIKEWNEASVFIAQIETIQAVDNIEEILSCKGLDAVMVGPYDISGSLDLPGQLEHPKVVEAGQRVIEACKKFKKSCGTQVVEPNEKNVKQAFDSGFSFVVLSSDLFILWKWSERMQGIIKKVNKL